MMIPSLYKSKRNESGYFLILMIMIMAAFATYSVTVFGVSLRSAKSLKHDYLEKVAQSVAYSGIELAKNDLWGTTQKALKDTAHYTYTYGQRYFTKLPGRRLQCRVNVYLQKGHLYLESAAQISPLNDFAHSPVKIQTTVKQLFKISGTPPALTPIRKVCG